MQSSTSTSYFSNSTGSFFNQLPVIAGHCSLVAQDMITILGSRFFVFFFLFEDIGDIHMSYDSYEANGYIHNSDLLFISHKLCVPYPTRSGCKEESIP